jgi:hypothetical protein
MNCNQRASSLVFESFDAKRDYLRQTVAYTGETDVTEEPDYTGELVMQPAVWEELPESGIDDIDDVSAYNEQAELRQIGLCAQLTRKGKYCELSADKCTFHDKSDISV